MADVNLRSTRLFLCTFCSRAGLLMTRRRPGKPGVALVCVLHLALCSVALEDIHHAAPSALLDVLRGHAHCDQQGGRKRTEMEGLNSRKVLGPRPDPHDLDDLCPCSHISGTLCHSRFKRQENGPFLSSRSPLRVRGGSITAMSGGRRAAASAKSDGRTGISQAGKRARGSSLGTAGACPTKGQHGSAVVAPAAELIRSDPLREMPDETGPKLTQQQQQHDHDHQQCPSTATMVEQLAARRQSQQRDELPWANTRRPPPAPPHPSAAAAAAPALRGPAPPRAGSSGAPEEPARGKPPGARPAGEVPPLSEIRRANAAARRGALPPPPAPPPPQALAGGARFPSRQAPRGADRWKIRTTAPSVERD